MKYALGLLSGSIFSAGCVIWAGGRPTAWLSLGFLLALGVSGGILWLTGPRRLARFLTAFADAWEGNRKAVTGREPSLVRRSAQSVESKPSGYVRPSKKQELQIMNDSIEEYKSRMTPSTTSRRSKDTEEFLNDPELFGASSRVV
jgi:hypothetical protein